jgi:hypothetical protein
VIESRLTRCRIIEYINKHEGVEWVTMEQMADDFKKNHKVPEGAKMPAPPGEILKLQKEGKAYSGFEYNGPIPE